MLSHTFIHVQGIGYKTESNLWKKGLLTWQDFLKHGESIFSRARDQFVREELGISLEHCNDILFFQDRLSSENMWRIFNAFKEKAVYLDIETSGGYQGMDEITVIGLYDGCNVHTFVNGSNLDEFEISISQYDLVITFNGTTFDLP
ncbi:MAG: ribonuclease H-like domain-containing protein, partial [Gammaproteobacteria bacterium]|nr:ribonuclease H-like domain-containing protein [Gammaproteobacteria bacterium]